MGSCGFDALQMTFRKWMRESDAFSFAPGTTLLTWEVVNKHEEKGL